MPRIISSPPLPKAISVLLDCSLPVSTKANLPLPTQVILVTHPLASFAARHPETSNGLLRTQVSFLPYTNSPSLPPIPRISRSFRYPSRTQTRHSGACSTLLMQAIISPPGVSSSERYKRIHRVQAVGVRGSASPERRPKRKLYGKPSVRETRTASSGSSSVRR